MISPKKFKRPFRPTGKYYRVNFRITAATVRLLDEKGIQIGIFSKDEALRRARELGVDLVEIAPKAIPPVCKLIDFKKFKYLESKRERESKKKVKNVDIKQVMLSPFMGEHDFETREVKGREFLKNGDKLKIVVRFKGRQIAKSDFGFAIIRKMIDKLSDISGIERPPHLEGKMIIAQLYPILKKGSVKNENEEQKSNSETI